MTTFAAKPALPFRLACLLLLAIGAVDAGAASLDATERRIVKAVDKRVERWPTLLAETVNIESATENHAGVRAVADVYAREYRALGFETRWVELPPQVNRAGHFVATHEGRAGSPRFLLIGHLDTVLQGEAFRREGNRGYGSGASDMKGGNLVALEAVRALGAAGELQHMNVTVVYTGDEEDTGSPLAATRDALLAAARGADIALAFEGATPGKGVIGRRGIGSWLLQVTGTQAHSSGIFGESGYGAIFETARILDRFRTELREANLTYNPSVIVGGTKVAYDMVTKSGTALGKTNVIPRQVQVEGDIRYLGAEQFEAARRKMQEIVAANLSGTSAKIDISGEYPSMAPNPGSERILAVFDAVSRDLGAGPVVAQPPVERGAGDIAFVCEDGRLACLDGLGSIGDHEHAPGEYIELDRLPLQVKRAAVLMHRLVR
jgi:glutamate carboxypeptidase